MLILSQGLKGAAMRQFIYVFMMLLFAFPFAARSEPKKEATQTPPVQQPIKKSEQEKPHPMPIHPCAPLEHCMPPSH